MNITGSSCGVFDLHCGHGLAAYRSTVWVMNHFIANYNNETHSLNDFFKQTVSELHLHVYCNCEKLIIQWLHY